MTIRFRESLEPRLLFAAGDLDISYGNNGETIGVSDTLRQFLKVENGKALAVIGNNRGEIVGVERIDAQGQADESFGSHGVVLFQAPIISTSVFESVALASDGSFFLQLQSSANSQFSNSSLSHYRSDGTIDFAFARGRLTYRNLLGTDEDYLHNVFPQTDGGVIVDATGVLTRLTSAGAIDRSWGTKGSVRYIDGGFRELQSQQLPNGRILLSGTLIGPDKIHHAAMRMYDSTGQLVSSFGTRGTAILNASNSYALYTDVVLAPDGQSLYVEDEDLAGHEQYWRWSTSGVLDTSYAANGMLGPFTDTDYPITLSDHFSLDDSGRIYLRSGPIVNRYALDGTPDPLLQNYYIGPDRILSAALGSGRMLLVGDNTGGAIALQMDGTASHEVTQSAKQIIVRGSSRDDDLKIGYDNAVQGKWIITNHSIGWAIPATGDPIVRVLAYAGDDTVTNGLALRSSMSGGDGRDVLTGGSRADSLFGEDGNDSINGRGSIDWLDGGAGNDFFYSADHLQDEVWGGIGHDLADMDKNDYVHNVEEKLIPVELPPE